MMLTDLDTSALFHRWLRGRGHEHPRETQMKQCFKRKINVSKQLEEICRLKTPESVLFK